MQPQKAGRKWNNTTSTYFFVKLRLNTLKFCTSKFRIESRCHEETFIRRRNLYQYSLAIKVNGSQENENSYDN